MPDLLAQLSVALEDRYEILHPLGAGGMAMVYLARDLHHQRDVALKVLRPELVVLEPARFEREITITASLAHPSILPLLDSGHAGGLLWYTMPYFTGKTLKDRLAEQGPLPLAEALAIVGDVAGALEYAHRRGILHRDLKPGNILLQEGRAVLADFGIALPLEEQVTRLTESGFSVGTPEYMSPEQALATRQLDARSDVYALGCVLYEALAGEPPFTGPTAQAVVAKRLLEPPPRLRTLREVPPQVEAAVTRALAREPADRFDSAAAFVRALDAAPPAPGRRRRATGAAVALLLVAGLTAVALAVRRSATAGIYDPTLVAILPARVAASDHSVEYLREGFVDLAAARLTGEGGPRAADPRTTLAAVHAIGNEDPEALARRLGAGRVLDASILGNGRQLTLTATLVSYPGGSRQAPVTVEGPEDSLGVLVDRLMIQVLALHAGLHTSALTTVKSLPAWRAYLAGKTAYRSGQYRQASDHFGEALAGDSTFVLAALADISARARSSLDFSERLTQVHRALARLGPADSLWFLVLAGPRYPASSNARDQIRFMDSALSRLSDRPDAWFELGDMQLHAGSIVDLPDNVMRAKQSFERSLALDSSFALTIEHLLYVAYWEEDTAAARRLMPLLLAHDSSGDRTGFYRWRSAVALGDSAAVARERAGFASLPTEALRYLVAIPQGDGIGVGDAILADAILSSRAASARAREEDRLRHGLLQLTLGRAGPSPLDLASARILNTLFNDGDPDSAGPALAQLRGAGPLHGSSVSQQDWINRYSLGLWELSRGQVAEARAIAAELRSHPVRPGDPDALEGDQVELPALLEAGIAMALHAPDAAARVQRFDSLMAAGIQSSVLEEAALLLGRWFRELQQPALALRALRRTPISLLLPYAVAPRALARARVAVTLGDTAEARRSYRLYLALRRSPDARLIPQRDSAARELVALPGH